jgi:hypothetical protein
VRGEVSVVGFAIIVSSVIAVVSCIPPALCVRLEVAVGCISIRTAHALQSLALSGGPLGTTSDE